MINALKYTISVTKEDEIRQYMDPMQDFDEDGNEVYLTTDEMKKKIEEEILITDRIFREMEEMQFNSVAYFFENVPVPNLKSMRFRTTESTKQIDQRMKFGKEMFIRYVTEDQYNDTRRGIQLECFQRGKYSQPRQFPDDCLLRPKDREPERNSTELPGLGGYDLRVQLSQIEQQ